MGVIKGDLRPLLVVGAALLCLLLAWQSTTMNAQRFRAWSYTWYREYMRWQEERATRHWRSLEGKHIILRYQDEDNMLAQTVLKETEAIYPQVTGALGTIPTQKPLVLLYPDRTSFNQVFGWKDESAMGVYYAGVVRVLSPRIWIKSDNQHWQDTWRLSGPMAHELAHMVLDYHTGGNVARWFTEGVAQDIERQLTGYTLSGPGRGWSERLYPWDKMDAGFDKLPDQRLAYRQSLLAIDRIKSAGQGALEKSFDALARGQGVEEAVETATGLSWERFNQEIHLLARQQERETTLRLAQ